MQRLDLIPGDHAQLCRRSKTIAVNERGSIAPFLAVVMLVATAGAALAVDMARAYSLKTDLQAAADAAALAAAVMLPDTDAARKAAARAVSQNLPGHQDLLRPSDFEFGLWDAANHSIITSEHAKSAVQVTVQRKSSRGTGVNMLFAGILGSDTLDVSASATAGKRGVACLIALDPKGKGLKLKGNADLELIECGAQINATGKEALIIEGEATFLSDSICVGGRTKIKGQVDVSPEPSEYCPPHADPLAGIDMPEFGACTDDHVEYRDRTMTLNADRVFCGGLKLSGKSHITLQPGLYVVDNGKFEIKDDAVLEGDGVTILLHGKKAELDIKNRAALRLTAPTEGALQGLLIVQSEGQGQDKKMENRWDSDAASELTGVVYLPHGRFKSLISSNITGTEACFVLIVKELKLEGDAKMSIDLSSSACRNSLPSAFSRSVVLLS